MIGSRNVRVLYIWPAGGPVVNAKLRLTQLLLRKLVPIVIIEMLFLYTMVALIGCIHGVGLTLAGKVESSHQWFGSSVRVKGLHK
jgi:hypothetical protein